MRVPSGEAELVRAGAAGDPAALAADGGRPWDDHDHGGGWPKRRQSCPPAPRGPRRASRH